MGRARRLAWFLLGWAAVAVGGIGIVVPGLPTTGFFVLAAGCFAKSSPRFEQWVLDLPKIGPLARGYRAGLGMPRRAKVTAVTMMVVACSISAVVVASPVVSPIILLAGAIGVWYVTTRIATSAATPAGAPDATSAG